MMTATPNLQQPQLLDVAKTPVLQGDFEATLSTKHGVPVYVIDTRSSASEHPDLWVVLRPTAEAIGLSPSFFRTSLRRKKLSEVAKELRLVQLAPTQLLKLHAVTSTTHSQSVDTRTKVYQVLPVRKLEVLLNDIDGDRLKDNAARQHVLKLQKAIAKIVERYYHEGGAVNPKATHAQLAALASKIEKLKAKLKAEKEMRRAVEKAKGELHQKATAAVRHWRKEAATAKSELQQTVSQCATIVAESTANTNAALQLAEESVGNLRVALRIPQEVPVDEFLEFLKQKIRRKISAVLKEERAHHRAASLDVLRAARAGAAFHPSVWALLAYLFPNEDVNAMRDQSSSALAQLAQPEIIARLISKEMLRAYLNQEELVQVGPPLLNQPE